MIVIITRWSVGPHHERHPGRLVDDRLVLAAGGESLRYP